MLSEPAFVVMLNRLERYVVDIDRLKNTNRETCDDLNKERLALGGMTKERDAGVATIADLKRDRERMAALIEDQGRRINQLVLDLDAARKRAELFPLLIDRKNHVYVALPPGSGHVDQVQDVGGLYQRAGAYMDYAALVAAPLGPRCFAVCEHLNLLRLPAPPTGGLKVTDDIPF